MYWNQKHTIKTINGSVVEMKFEGGGTTTTPVLVAKALKDGKREGIMVYVNLSYS